MACSGGAHKSGVYEWLRCAAGPRPAPRLQRGDPERYFHPLTQLICGTLMAYVDADLTLVVVLGDFFTAWVSIALIHHILTSEVWEVQTTDREFLITM